MDHSQSEIATDGKDLRLSIQRKYAENHPYDEIIQAFQGEYVPRDEVHEIKHGSHRTFTEWNMLAVSRQTHDKLHEIGVKGYRYAFIAKIINGTIGEPPADIVRAYDLGLILRNKDRFLRRWLLHRYHTV